MSSSSQHKILGIGAAIAIAGTIYLSRVWREISKDVTEEDDNTEEEEFPIHLKREIYKEQRRQEKIPLLAMKKPMYDNIRMLDPQGELLCTISMKKARWYIKKDLGSWVDQDEKTTIQLLFEPSHRSNQSQENKEDEQEAFFNKSIKDNVCVVCGNGEYFMRHYIVPYTCRSLLPNKYKMHMAHDVVILCPDCHLECKKISTNRVKFLEKQCRKDPKTAIQHFTDRELYKVKSVSLALLRWKDKIPPAKVEEYEILVKDHFQINDSNELIEEVLQKGTQIDSDIPNPDYIPASKVIVEALCKDDETITAFVKGWRKHFLETMEPQYLPQGWNVDSPVECKNPERKGTPTAATTTTTAL